MYEDYPANQRWNPATGERAWQPPRSRRGEYVAWHHWKNATDRYPGHPPRWTEANERQGLIESILDLQKWRKYTGQQFDQELLARFSNAKLEYIFGQMMLAAADGRAPQRHSHTAG